MSINLNYILSRNNTSLDTFIQKNRLTSYAELVEYCSTRKFVPCSEEEYNKVVQKVAENNDQRVSRTVSKTQDTKKRRNSRKKKPNSSKLSNSANKR